MTETNTESSEESCERVRMFMKQATYGDDRPWIDHLCIDGQVNELADSRIEPDEQTETIEADS